MVRSIFSGLGNQYAGTLITGLGQLVVTAVLARLLTPEDYGLAGLATVYIGLAAILSQYGISAALIQRPELTPRYVRAGFTATVLIGVLTTTLVWLTAPLAAAVLGNAALTPVIRGLSFGFALANPGVVAEALLQRHLAWRSLMWADVAAFVLGYALPALALAAAGYGVWALVGSAVGSNLVRSAALLKLQPHPKWPRIGPEIRELLRYGSGFTLARVFNYGASQGDNLVVGRVLGIVALGYYNRAFKLMLILVTYFATVTTRVLFPVMSRLQGERERLRSTYLTGAAVLGLVSAPLGALMVVLAPEIVGVVLGPKWTPTIMPFQILTAGIMLRNVYLMAYCLDGALGAMGNRTLRDGVYAAAVLTGSLIGTRFGLAGVAAGVVLAIAVNYVLGAAMSLRMLGATWRDYAASQLPAFGLGLLTAAVAHPTRLGLLAAGAGQLLVLVLTGCVSLGVLGALYVVRPSIIGRYGGIAVRHVREAIGSRFFPAEAT
ncbi:MAG TPA: lipopolysaccharide biosynthesis protein [Gemmatimonadales bacterium]|nr:lipopolysaccharide biosynthesis protein [Gemmatimonadales bacterium]